MTTGNYSHVDMVWEDPGIALFLRTLASFSRLIVFDRRGTGTSDPLPPGSLPPWESYAQDLAAVLDEVGSEQAALLAQLDASSGGPRPWPPCSPPAASATCASAAGWPGFQRAVASPRAVQAFLRANVEMDARPILPLIQAPILVLHRRDYQFIPIANGRHLAERIPGAVLVDLSGTERSLFWETPEPALDHIERFLTGIVGSTRCAGELGDRRWRELSRAPRTGDPVCGRAQGGTGRHRRRHPGGVARRRARATWGRRRWPGRAHRGPGDGGGPTGRDPGVPDRAGPGRRHRRHPGGGMHLLKGVDGDWQLHAVARP